MNAMKMIAVAIALCLGAQGARAADAFTVDEAIGIAGALNLLTCGNRVVKDGAKETVICDPYKWSPGVAWVIARNISRAQEAAKQFDRMREAAIAKMARKEDGSPREDSVAALNVTIRGWLDTPAKIELEKLKRSDLEDKNIPPPVLSVLLPIIE